MVNVIAVSIIIIFVAAFLFFALKFTAKLQVVQGETLEKLDFCNSLQTCRDYFIIQGMKASDFDNAVKEGFIKCDNNGCFVKTIQKTSEVKK